MRLAYSDEGSGSAVVLLHGFPLSRAMWREQIAALAPSHRVIAPDLRGHGGSPDPEGLYTMDELADDVIELLDGLGIGGPIALGGLSMGGYVALSIMERCGKRVGALLLMDTRASADTPEAARDREANAQAVLAAQSARSLVEKMVPRLFSQATLNDHPERVEPLRCLMEETSPRGIAGALRGMAIRPDRRALLAQIAVPTLVLVGEDDVVTPPDEARGIASAIPGARLVVIPKAGHLAPYENPGASNQAILQFLATAGHR